MTEDVFDGVAAVARGAPVLHFFFAGVPRYVRRPFSAEERRLLRRWFGIEEPSRLYSRECWPRLARRDTACG